MQRNIKNKVTFFTFGLLAGVTLGVVFGVAIKELFSHLNNLKVVIANLGSKEDKMAQKIDSLEGKIQSQDKKTVVMVVKNNVKGSQQETIHKSVGVDSPDNSLHSTAIADTTNVPGNESDTNVTTNNEVVVMTNQLITVSNISLVNMDSLQDKKSDAAKKTDSLASSLNEMGQVASSNKYRVEFWMSPINFRGYKMSMGKIVIYGVSTKAPLKLLKLDDNYYMQSDQMVYRLTYTDDLRPFDKVTDKTILKKFNL